MKPVSLLGYVVAGVLSGLPPMVAAADLAESDPNNVRAASVYIQRIASGSPSSAPAPALLAEVRYDILDPATAQVVAYEPPEDGDDEAESDESAESAASRPVDELYRIGLYDPQSKAWLGGTSVAAGSNFAKGYSPQFILTVAGSSYVGVSVRGLAIDAGATRDFGPQALVVVAGKGATPVLNRPVVLNPEGKKAAPEEEKTFLQKYWWAMALALVMVVTSGGGE